MERNLGALYQKAKSNEYVKTTAETGLHIGAVVVFLHMAEKLKLPVTVTRPRPTLEGAISAVVEAPIFEEIESRFIPGSMFKENSLPDQAVKFWSTLKFAYAHNYTKEGEFHLKTVPAYHFSFGLLAWRIMRQRGLRHAIFAHALNNAVAVGVTMYENRKTRKNARFTWNQVEKEEIPVSNDWEIIEK